MQADPMHFFNAKHRIMVAAPDCDRSIVVLFDLRFRRHKRSGAVMLRPVELDSPGDPRTSEPHQRGLDYVLSIKEVIIVRFVIPNMDATPNFGKNHQAEILIFDMDCLPHLFPRLSRHSVDEWQGINPPAASLIDAFLQKHGIAFRAFRAIGVDLDILPPRLDRPAQALWSHREVEFVAELPGPVVVTHLFDLLGVSLTYTDSVWGQRR